MWLLTLSFIHFWSDLSHHLMYFPLIYPILVILKVYSKTMVFRELETAVLVLGLRPRPRSELKTLDRLLVRNFYYLCIF